jgi:hypothetical protein
MKLLTDVIRQALIFRSIQPIGSIFALETDADSCIPYETIYTCKFYFIVDKQCRPGPNEYPSVQDSYAAGALARKH